MSEVKPKPENRGLITKAANAEKSIVSSIINQLGGRGIQLDDYQKECCINAISAINNLLYTNGLDWGSENLDPSNYQDVIKKVGMQKLNAMASNREVYFQLRNTKVGDKWKKMIEVGLEGDGNDAILRNFGVNVKKVFPFWEVREGDKFEYPAFKGIEITPPIWAPTGKGKVVRVVYPIQLNDGTIEYRISEREDVKKNLVAHINNNMMNETFGICADRYHATAEQKAKIEEKKQECKVKMSAMTLEQILDCADFLPWISPSWSDEQSRESMIVRKMRNNAIKKFPKDFGNAYVKQAYDEFTDEAIATTAHEIKENANQGEFIDVTDVSEEPKKINSESVADNANSEQQTVGNEPY